MRPYIIINGKSSNEIGGLLIQSLPPISKPQMRTKVEEIDGRDGDIVTQLGYKAYDKTYKIGLYGDYDVDEVIEYLSEGGKITFSNELDKYYIFSPYAQVDLEKLLSFREAKVKIHVQPFKYDLLESVYNFDNDNTRGFKMGFYNKGNIFSKPKITITGSGSIRVVLNGETILTLTLVDQTIILDPVSLNATDPNGLMLNRLVRGSLDQIRFNKGENTLSLRGNVSKAIVENVSRWR